MSFSSLAYADASIQRSQNVFEPTEEFPDKNDSIVTFTPKNTYASVIQLSSIPNKEQGIILERIKDINLDVYISPTRKCLVSSIISNMWICIFLSNKKLVDEFLDQNTSVTINNARVIVRPYTSRDKKVTILNIPPYIPNCYIEELLESIDVHNVSAISTMKASIKDDPYSHVTCHRRQVYIRDEDVKKLPNVIRIQCDGALNSIFFSSDNVIKCFKCGAIAIYISLRIV
ncbi:hypothetical protein HHI36_007973 [Cryptolaemus montrouzieri]|uniref:Uncharacterized protein n=1 Tax=Cryptolaemus montrouzieri TaxID=559131 RepID=A0ABD2MR35_9CUCU